MRIHRITLRNFRGVEKADVEFDTSGVTIVEGRNEIGKTSLADAFMLLLDSKDSSSTQVIRDIQPIGQDVPPFAEAELTLGPHRLIYRKQWLKDKKTELEIKGPEPTQLTGEAAHNRMTELLDAHTDPTLFRALRYQQGIAITQASLEHASSLEAALDAAAGGGGGSSDIGGHDALLERVETERLRYFTDKGAVPAARKSKAAQAEDLRAQADEARDRIRRLDAVAERQLQIERELIELAGRAPEIEQHVADTSKAVQGVEGVEGQLERAAHAAETAEAALRAATSSQQARAALVVAAEAAQATLATIEADLAAAAPGLDAAEQALAAATAARGGAAGALEEAEGEAAGRRGLAELLELRLQRDQFSERLKRVEAADVIIADAERFLSGCSIDDAKLSDIDTAATNLAVAKGRAESGQPHIALEALRPVQMIIDGDRVDATPGEPVEAAVAGRFEAEIGDLARIIVTRPHADGDAESALRDAQQTLDRMLADADASSPAHARELARERARYLGDRENARQRRDADLNDLDPPQLAAKLSRAQERLDALEAQVDTAAADATTIDDARALAGEADTQVEQARTHDDKQQTAVTVADGALRMLQDKAIEHRTRLQGANDDAARCAGELKAQREQTADVTLEEIVEQAQAAAAAATGARESAEGELAAADPQTARAELENAQELQARLHDDTKAREIESAETRAQLELEGHEGLAGRLADTQAKLTELEQDLESENRRAAAVERLHAILTAKREAAKQAYIGPYRDKINAYARILYGPDVEIAVDPRTFEITGRTLNGKPERFQQLSGGAREQLAVIARLACGALVSPPAADGTLGGVPVVIDDALGYSDPDKLAKIGAAFNVAGKDCQVIVLTCEPGRYRGVGGAKVISLG